MATSYCTNLLVCLNVKRMVNKLDSFCPLLLCQFEVCFSMLEDPVALILKELQKSIALEVPVISIISVYFRPVTIPT